MGDSAIERIRARHGEALRRTIQHGLRTSGGVLTEDVEDLEQEIYVRLLEHQARGKSLTQVKALRSARELVHQRLKLQRREARLCSEAIKIQAVRHPSGRWDPEDELVAPYLAAQVLQRRLEHMPSLVQHIVAEHHIQGRPQRQIAASRGMTPTAVSECLGWASISSDRFVLPHFLRNA